MTQLLTNATKAPLLGSPVRVAALSIVSASLAALACTADVGEEEDVAQVSSRICLDVDGNCGPGSNPGEPGPLSGHAAWVNCGSNVNSAVALCRMNSLRYVVTVDHTFPREEYTQGNCQVWHGGMWHNVVQVGHHPFAATHGWDYYYPAVWQVDVAILKITPGFSPCDGTPLSPLTAPPTDDWVLVEGYGEPNPVPTLRWGIFDVEGYGDTDLIIRHSGTRGINGQGGPNDYYGIGNHDCGGGGWINDDGEPGSLLGITSDWHGLTAMWAFRDWMTDTHDCGIFDTTQPSRWFCDLNCKCDAGEGDCDREWTSDHCKWGTICVPDKGAIYGVGHSGYDLCLPDPDRDPPNPNRSGSCGRIDGGCGPWEGDCNGHPHCMGELVCRHNVGMAIGASKDSDVCGYARVPGCQDYNVTMISNWQPRRHSNNSGWCSTDCPCGIGDGDCNGDSQCRGSLKCADDVGCKFGFTNPKVDVCVLPHLEEDLEEDYGCTQSSCANCP
jgi:hypothetical protein